MKKPKLLLHTCCAPCSSAILEHLYPYFDITCYFYNPNIENALYEYDYRLNELKRLIRTRFPEVNLISTDNNAGRFYTAVKGLENEHEGGKRCMKCYQLRLEQTAEYAVNNGFDSFTTTLTISPYKNSAVINAIGTQVASKYPNLMYLPWDFGYLYTRSIEICKELNLYQQDYCGCEFSKPNKETNI